MQLCICIFCNSCLGGGDEFEETPGYLCAIEFAGVDLLLQSFCVPSGSKVDTLVQWILQT